jgi:hypothetical protein
MVIESPRRIVTWRLARVAKRAIETKDFMIREKREERREKKSGRITYPPALIGLR